MFFIYPFLHSLFQGESVCLVSASLGVVFPLPHVPFSKHKVACIYNHFYFILGI